MITLLLATAASFPTAIDAEHAFARDARRIGQWSAFRKYADTDAVMFVPQATWAREFLKNRKNPPKSVRWWPERSFVSCDGRTAVNTGPATTADGKPYGTFTTVWLRDGRKWSWVYDNGGPLSALLPRRAKPQTMRASCRGKAPGAPLVAPPALTAKQARTTPEDNGRGYSADKSLGWDWRVEKNGDHHFRVYEWTGSRYAQVLYNTVPAK